MPMASCSSVCPAMEGRGCPGKFARSGSEKSSWGKRRVLFPVREEAKEAKRRRLTPVGFDAQRGKSSSEAQLQMRHYEEVYPVAGRSTSRLAAAVPGSMGRVELSPSLLPRSLCLTSRRATTISSSGSASCASGARMASWSLLLFRHGNE